MGTDATHLSAKVLSRNKWKKTEGNWPSQIHLENGLK